MRLNARIALAALVLLAFSCAKEIKVGPEEARTIAKEAYIYGLPIVENYKVVYAYSIYKDSNVFKAPLNHLAIVMPDTTQPDSLQGGFVKPPYALSWMDVRKEPVVITVPATTDSLAYIVQLVDFYTQNFDDISVPRSGEKASFMVVPGPWSGETPDGIARVIQCETLLALAIVRPWPSMDRAATEKLLDGFDVETLSEFQGKPSRQADAIIFPPYSKETANSAGFFQYLNFALQFCPVHPSEIQERARFAKLGIAAGKSFNVATRDPAMLQAINQGIAEAKSAIEQAPTDTARYGTRAELKNDFLARAVAAKTHLYGPPQP
ncbi:MAG TPA: DUF1254 domain-containing protein [Candidatus Krumholzibacteria bacterium]